MREGPRGITFPRMPSETRFPVLMWHGMNVGGNDPSNNDHVALRVDLEVIHRLGFRIVPLREIAMALRRGDISALAGCIGLSFDDGSDFDYHDLPHPLHGIQRGLANVVSDFSARHGVAAHATIFPIVSPAARRELDRTSMVGCGWWNDDWWQGAEAGGGIEIGSHSWDHNDPQVATSIGGPANSFQVATFEQARAEVAQAAGYLREILRRDNGFLFAYPFGDVTEFMAEEYLPKYQHEHSSLAAFTTTPAPVTASTSVWRIPRFVCGWHWKSPGELEALLKPFAPTSARFEPARANASTAAARLKTWEVNDATVVAGDLFQRSFGHPIPDYGRHFVLVYSPPPGDDLPRVVAYIHHTPFNGAHLTGGLCVEKRLDCRMPADLFEQVRREDGSLASKITRESVELLGDTRAAIAHVGDTRAHQAIERIGYRDTGEEHLMVYWRRELAEAERRALLAEVKALGAF